MGFTRGYSYLMLPYLLESRINRIKGLHRLLAIALSELGFLGWEDSLLSEP